MRCYQNELLAEQGYLSIDRIATDADLQTIRGVLERFWQGRVGYAQGALFDFVGNDERGLIDFPQFLRPSDFAGELRKTELFQAATKLAQSLLGPGARFVTDHALIKPAHNGPETPWHQDEAFRDPGRDWHEISIWVALQPVDLTNGCMQFIPGSHKGNILPHRSPGGNRRAHALECYEGFNASDAIACPLPAGGCTVHTGRTLHYTGKNISERNRMAYVLIFDLRPVPAETAREAPWLQERITARDEREHAWRRRGGVLVEVWRRLHRIDIRRPDDRRALFERVTRIFRLRGNTKKKLLRATDT